MSPAATTEAAAPPQNTVVVPELVKGAQTLPEPLKSSGSLDAFESIDVTPIIGTEFPKANLAEWIAAPNADALLRDLAIKSTSIPSLHLDSSNFSCSL